MFFLILLKSSHDDGNVQVEREWATLLAKGGEHWSCGSEFEENHDPDPTW